jgi:hypothetical protein
VAFLTTVQEGGNFEVSLADGGTLPLQSAPAIPGTGTVTSVTGTPPIVITGSPTSTPNVTITAATDGAAGSMSAADKTKLDATPAFPTVDLTAAGLVMQVSGLTPSEPLVVNFPLPSTTESYLSLHRVSGGADINLGPFGASPSLSALWCGVVPGASNYTFLFGGTTAGIVNSNVPTIGGTALHQWLTDGANGVFAIGISPSGQGCNLTSNNSGFAGGVGVVKVTDRTTAPTSNPAGGGILYSEAGAGKWHGSSGTVTTFGPAEPHCPVCGSDFVTEHESPVYGYLSVCLKCMADELGERPWIRRAKVKS